MPTEPIQQLLVAFEISLSLAGVWLIVLACRSPEVRRHWFGPNRMTFWPVAPAEFALFLLLIFFGGLFFQIGARLALGGIISRAGDRSGLEVFVYGAAFHGGALLGWSLFPSLRRRLYWEYGANAPTPAAGPGLPWSKVATYAVCTLLIVLPLLLVLSTAWTGLLHRLGLPEEPQDLIAIFANTKSPVVIAGMLVVACVIAPLNEELLFRAGIHRFCRQRFGRGWALLISAGLFGALHGNWAGFLPLALLGAGLALAYEATGDIRVTIVAHALFNLNTILIVLSGLKE